PTLLPVDGERRRTTTARAGADANARALLRAARRVPATAPARSRCGMSRSFTSREIDWGADEIADAPDVESPDTERTSAHRGTQPDGVPHAHQTGACGLDADALE